MQVRGRVHGSIAFAVAAVVGISGCTSSSPGAATTSPAAGSTAATSSPAGSSSTTASSSPGSPASTSPSAAGTSGGHGSAARPIGPAGGPVPARFTPTSTTFVSADTGWVLGTAPCASSPCTSILQTRDGGRSWRGIPAPRASLGQPDSGRNGDVSVLRFADQSDGWAGVGRLYSTHDGGATWHRQTIGTSTSVVSAIETGGGHVYATTDGCPSQGGNSCSFTTRVYASDIGRDRWTPVTPQLSGGNGPSRIVVHGHDWFLPTRSAVYHGHDTSGPTRLPNPCPLRGGVRPAPSLAVADSSHLDALCQSDGAAGSATYQLYGTTDGGRSWSRAGGPHREGSNETGIADNGRGVLLVSVASGRSQILRTTDDGGSFHSAAATTAGGGVGWADLGFTTTSQAVVVLHGIGLYVSHDGGASFGRVTF